MNEKNLQEIAYRRLAFKLFDKGYCTKQILQQIPRSRAWLAKWRKRFTREGCKGFDSLSKAPKSSAQSYKAKAVAVVLRVRRRLQASRVGLCHARAVRQEILRHKLLKPLPSISSINRWMRAAGLTQKAQVEPTEVFYPALRLPPNLIWQAMDWTARYLTGGSKVFVFHTLDLQTHALCQSLASDKSSGAAINHILEAFSELGVPDFLQVDNDSAFNGIGKKWRFGGDFIRLGLYLGVELIFIPPGEPERNHQVEGVHNLWATAFWNKDHFNDEAAVRRKSKKFLAWYQSYAPPALQGLTVQEAGCKKKRTRLRQKQIDALPQRLTLTAGRVHFIRKVSATGEIKILGESFQVSKRLAHRYVWATIDTAAKSLQIYYRRSARATARRIKKMSYSITEKVHRLKPEFRRRKKRVSVLRMI